MRRLFCFFGLHRYYWNHVSHTCELWSCVCGKVLMQFTYEPRSCSEVEQLNQWMKRSEGNRVGR